MPNFKFKNLSLAFFSNLKTSFIEKKFRNFFVKNILFLLFILSSCGDRCIDKDEFYDNQVLIYGNPSDMPTGTVRPAVFGTYNPDDGGQYREWQNTGMISDGGPIKIWIWGDIVASNGEFANGNDLSDFPVCKYCFKDSQDPNVATQNCYCGPVINGNNEFFDAEESIAEINDQYGATNPSGITCSSDVEKNDINKCTCKTKLASLPNLDDPRYISFSKDMYLKILNPDPSNPSSFLLQQKNPEDQFACRHNMGYGLYISLWGQDGETMPDRAYHMFTLNKFCPKNFIKSNKKCEDSEKNLRWVYVYTSPNNAIFQKNDSERHGENEVVKINFHDQYHHDNKGNYKLQFISGVFQRDDKGLISNIVSTMEDFLFGYSRMEDGAMVTKTGVIEFMYKAVLNDRVVKAVVQIGFVIYIAFFGVGFFLGLVELNRKEIMMRLLKIGLVLLFTNPFAWEFYNRIVVGFFKDGMNSICNMIVGIYTSLIELSYVQKITPETSVVSNTLRSSSNFIYVDALIRDLLSDPASRKIWSLFSMKEGKGFYAIIYVPAIYYLIFYFIYVMIDIAIKYLINLFKICIGLALGPTFIFLSLFEKTKDMFKNWLAFMGSRSFEIILLFAFIHPFITILEILFKEMLYFKICPEGVGEYSYLVSSMNILKPEEIHKRSLFWWFEHFLKIGAMIYITQSVANKSAYISGQIVSVGGISNADPVSETGKGEEGFKIGSAIVKGALANLKAGLNSQYVKGVAQKVGRSMAKGITGAMRAEIINGKSVNDLVNDSFNAIGIRNRGLRSFARDQKIDSFINQSIKEADSSDLKGEDRDNYIKARVNALADDYKLKNKNYAVLLGIDDKNIEKRMDQKLVKEPMKQQIKQFAMELREQGIIGKEAQNMIVDKVQEWGIKQFGNNEKVAEFFKKTKMKSFLNKQSNMDVKDALRYVKFLEERDGNSAKANEFKDKYRDVVNQNAIRRAVKKQKNIDKFGALGKVGNAISELSNQAQRVNPFAYGLHKSNPNLTLRKFDRKLKRIEMDKQDGGFINKNIINNRGELFPIKKDDTFATKALKAIPNLIGKPISKLIVKPLMNTPERYENSKKFVENLEKKYPAVKVVTVPTKLIAKTVKLVAKLPIIIVTSPKLLLSEKQREKIGNIGVLKFVKDKYSNFNKSVQDKYDETLEKSREIKSEHDKNQIESYRRIGEQYKPNKDARFRDNKKDLEELVKKIDQCPKDEEKTIFENLTKKQRLIFQKEINAKIDDMINDIKEPDQSIKGNKEEADEKIAKIQQLKNVIFLDDNQIAKLDPEIKKIIEDANSSARSFIDLESLDYNGISSLSNNSPNMDSANFDPNNNTNFDSIKYGENNIATQILDSHMKIDNFQDELNKKFPAIPQSFFDLLNKK
jgi:type IV secretory pathway VirB6-like protein